MTLSSDANVAVPALDLEGNAAGFRAVPCSVLWRDIVRLVREGGLSWSEAIALATRNVARVLGLSSRKGAIRPGFDADFAIVDADLANLSNDEIGQASVTQTWIRGEPAYQKGQ